MHIAYARNLQAMGMKIYESIALYMYLRFVMTIAMKPRLAPFVFQRFPAFSSTH